MDLTEFQGLNPDDVRQWLHSKEADTAAELALSEGAAYEKRARVDEVKREKAIEMARRILGMTEDLFADPYNAVDGFSAEAWMNLSTSIGWKAVTQHMRHRKWAEYWENQGLTLRDQGTEYGGTGLEIDEQRGNETKIIRNRRAAEEYEIWVYASEFIHKTAIDALQRASWEGTLFFPDHGFDISEKAFSEFCNAENDRYQKRRQAQRTAQRVANQVDAQTQLHFLSNDLVD